MEEIDSMISLRSLCFCIKTNKRISWTGSDVTNRKFKKLTWESLEIIPSSQQHLKSSAGVPPKQKSTFPHSRCTSKACYIHNYSWIINLTSSTSSPCIWHLPRVAFKEQKPIPHLPIRRLGYPFSKVLPISAGPESAKRHQTQSIREFHLPSFTKSSIHFALLNSNKGALTYPLSLTMASNTPAQPAYSFPTNRLRMQQVLVPWL